jgi:glutamate:GABA antiporter
MSQGAAWMIISDRMQAMAAADGAFFGGFFGKFSKRLGTPTRVNFMSGVVGTVFMIAAMQLSGTNGAIFGVVLSIAVSTYLLSYLFVVPAAIRLRSRYPETPRPFRVPVGIVGFRVLGVLCMVWIVLGSWVAIFPGVLESLFGLKYDFMSEWGVSQGTFEAFTLGTLLALLILGLVGYWRGKGIRAHLVAEPDPEAELVSVNQ